MRHALGRHDNAYCPCTPRAVSLAFIARFWYHFRYPRSSRRHADVPITCGGTLMQPSPPIATTPYRLVWRTLLLLGLLYGFLILYPSYTSGLATFTSDPQTEWDEAAHPVPLFHDSLGFFLFYPTFWIYLLARYGTFPLAGVLIWSCIRPTQRLPRWEQILYLSTSGLALGVLLSTWSAGPPFMNWLLD
jgi:hypothetical protein